MPRFPDGTSSYLKTIAPLDFFRDWQLGSHFAWLVRREWGLALDRGDEIPKYSMTDPLFRAFVLWSRPFGRLIAKCRSCA
jgi:hypothetical protein